MTRKNQQTATAIQVGEMAAASTYGETNRGAGPTGEHVGIVQAIFTRDGHEYVLMDGLEFKIGICNWVPTLEQIAAETAKMRAEGSGGATRTFEGVDGPGIRQMNLQNGDFRMG